MTDSCDLLIMYIRMHYLRQGLVGFELHTLLPQPPGWSHDTGLLPDYIVNCLRTTLRARPFLDWFIIPSTLSFGQCSF